jgi:hypothetical protein
MTTTDKIRYLKAAEAAFRNKPSQKDGNYLGLCSYFYVIHKMSLTDLLELIGDRFHYTGYTFGKGQPQYLLYDRLSSNDALLYERADWCRTQIERYGCKKESEK